MNNYCYTKYAVAASYADEKTFPWSPALIYKSPIDGHLTSLRFTLHSALDLNFEDREDAIKSIIEFAKKTQFVGREYHYSIIRINRKSKYSVETLVVSKYSITLVDVEDTRSLLIKEI